MLTEQDLQRYKRQLMIHDWGEEAQQRIRDSKVVVAGAGGLGSAILTYLAVAGVGTIRVIDSDEVEISNLNRQILHTDADIGKTKAASAGESLQKLNPNIQVETISEPIMQSNVLDLLQDYLIVDALDNLDTRLLLNKVSIRNSTPLFHGAVYGFEGRVTTFVPGQTPCLQCLYQGSLGWDVPVVGVTPGIIGCIQATEVLKYIMGIGELLLGRLVTYDGRYMKFGEVRFKKSPTCEACK